MIIRQSSLGVSICPMLAWKREGEGLEQAAQGVGLYLFYWIKKQCTKPKALGPKQESTHGRCTPGCEGRGVVVADPTVCLVYPGSTFLHGSAWLCPGSEAACSLREGKVSRWLKGRGCQHLERKEWLPQPGES